VSDLQLTAFERAVITTILKPSHPVMDALREQLEACLVTDREFTGTGFFTGLHVPAYVPDAPVTRDPRAEQAGLGLDGPGLQASLTHAD
jgi:hypothetical protein